MFLSIWLPTSPFHAALGIWAATVGSMFGGGIAFYHVSGVGTTALLTLPWLRLAQGSASARKWRGVSPSALQYWLRLR